MRTRSWSRFAGVAFLVGLSLAFFVLPSTALASCVSEYSGCRDNADRRFRNGVLSVYGYAIEITGCENELDYCETYCKEKENGK